MSSIVALLPRTIAKEGFKFILFSEAESCVNCKLRKVCIENLEMGRCYEVDQVRKKSFRCPVYGDMQVCKVKIVNELFISVPRSDAIEGMMIRYIGSRCQEVTCPNFDLCNPIGVKNGDEMRIVRVDKNKLSCKLGLDLVKCLVNII